MFYSERRFCRILCYYVIEADLSGHELQVGEKSFKYGLLCHIGHGFPKYWTQKENMLQSDVTLYIVIRYYVQTQL